MPKKITEKQIIKSVCMSPTTFAAVKRRLSELKVSFSWYVRSLISKDIEKHGDSAE